MSTEADDTAITTQAILELTDAHVSPASADAWDTAVADVRHEAEENATPLQEAVNDAVAVAEAFG